MTAALRLSPGVFDEVKADLTATRQAVIVVVMAATSIGFGVGPGFGIPLGFVLWWSSSWAVWVFVVYLLAPSFSRVTEEENSWGLYARPTGFAQTPLIFLVVLSFIPETAPNARLVLFVAVSVWWLAVMSLAVRQALGLASGFASVAVAATFLIPAIVIELVASSQGSVGV